MITLVGYEKKTYYDSNTQTQQKGEPGGLVLGKKLATKTEVREMQLEQKRDHCDNDC